MLFLAPRPPGIPEALSTRTAIVMPIYNESPERVFAAVEAMYEEIEATGLGRAFEWFFLSDTTNPDVFVAEEQAFPQDARAPCGPQAKRSGTGTGRRTPRARPATSPIS